jgi:hypothetical protein
MARLFLTEIGLYCCLLVNNIYSQVSGFEELQMEHVMVGCRSGPKNSRLRVLHM